MVDSASSGYSENFEFKIDGFKQNPERDEESSVMSMIEHFEKLKDTSCNEHYDLKEINNSSRKEAKYRTEVRQKECDFDEKVFQSTNKNTKIKESTADVSKNNSRAEILVNLRFRKKQLAKGNN